MTAKRWWVRIGARWLARIDGVSGQLRLAMLVMTGLSTATLTLRQYGYGDYAWPLIVVTGAAMVVFTYLYAEGGVWNQVGRDRNDLASNWAGPDMRITQEMLARAIAASRRDRELTDAERKQIQNELDAAFDELRDGIDLGYKEEQ